MEFKPFKFRQPDFNAKKYMEMPEIKTLPAEKDGVAPHGFYLTSHIPTFYKINGKWQLPVHNSMNCVAALKEGKIEIIELRDIKSKDLIVIGEKEDGSEGIIKYENGFPKEVYCCSGKAVETSFSDDYDYLFKLMKYEKENGGHIAWVLGPSVVFDHDTRNALNKLAENGYINCLLGGNAMATHDLEGGYLETALGQNIYTQENVPMGHYNHLDLLNEVRTAGSIKKFIDSGKVKDGIIKTLVGMDIPFVLCGSIRDDGPLPEVIASSSEALSKTKEQLDKATLIIGLATMLHNLSVANMASSYRIRANGDITPVYMYAVDVTENVVNKVAAAREHIAFVPMVTNVQDFVVNLEKALVDEEVE